MPFNKTLATELMKALTEEETSPKGLRALNTTLYTLTPQHVKQVLAIHKNVIVLQLTVEIEPGEATKKHLLAGMEQCASLEQVEIVVNPTLQMFMEVSLSPCHLEK